MEASQHALAVEQEPADNVRRPHPPASGKGANLRWSAGSVALDRDLLDVADTSVVLGPHDLEVVGSA